MSSDRITAGQLSGNLNFLAAQKMIYRLLNHERIKTDLDGGKIKGLGLSKEFEVKVAPFTKGKLAKKLGITLEELEGLKSPEFYERIADRLSLSLIHLYCATKFVTGEYKEG